MGINDNTIQDFLTTIKQEPKKTINKSGAVVSRLDEEGTVWVFVAGSETETPTESTTAEVKTGDSVTVEWRNNKLYIVGNNSNPAVGTEKVQKVEAEASQATFKASEAMAMAEEAMKKIAGDSNQYFWHTESGTDTGSHITEITEEDFIANPRGGNLLARSNGIAIRDGLTDMANFSSERIDLGMNSIESIISMCEDVGTFGVTQSDVTEVFIVDGKEVSVDGTWTYFNLDTLFNPSSIADRSAISLNVNSEKSATASISISKSAVADEASTKFKTIETAYISMEVMDEKNRQSLYQQSPTEVSLNVGNYGLSIGSLDGTGLMFSDYARDRYFFIGHPENTSAIYSNYNIRLWQDSSNPKSTDISVGKDQSSRDLGLLLAVSGNVGLYDYVNDRWLTHLSATDNCRYFAGLNFDVVLANRVLASPNGSDGKPFWRSLVSADIPNLNASKITAGTLDVDRIPSLSASKITSGTFADARIPAGILRKSELVGQTFSKTGLSVSASNYLANQTIDVTKSGYTAIGLLGVWCTGTGASFALPYSAYLDGNTVKFSIRNLGTSAASLNFYARVLYKES